MSIVAAHGIQKAYGPDVVLRSADVIIDPGQRVGMVGKNGAGKSTLARIIAGTETLTRARSRAAVARSSSTSTRCRASTAIRPRARRRARDSPRGTRRWPRTRR